MPYKDIEKRKEYWREYSKKNRGRKNQQNRLRYQKNRLEMNKRKRERYANDPEYREKRNEYNKKLCKTLRINNLEWKEERNSKQRKYRQKRYSEDANFRKYISEHSKRYHSKSYIKKGRKPQRGGENPNWKGDNVGYNQLHKWIKSRKPKPTWCEGCNKSPPYDLANISQKYKRDINDFEWLCRSCHMKKDGRINNLKRFK